MVLLLSCGFEMQETRTHRSKELTRSWIPLAPGGASAQTIAHGTIRKTGGIRSSCPPRWCRPRPNPLGSVAVMPRIPTTDLDVFPLCLGGNVFGWNVDEAGSFAVLDAYATAGGNFVDTADAYSMWIEGNSG